MRTETAQRVVVLGREGAARDQLVGALGDLGVEPVWVGRPKQNNPDALLALNPNKIVVSLEPAIELELEPYGEILGQPGISVVYDDAESSKGLDGWDLNRWARHFAAKLLGRSAMPPLPAARPEADASQLPATNAIPVFSEIPVAADFSPDPAPEPERESQWLHDSQSDTLEIDQNELQRALEQLNRSLAQGYSQEAELELGFGHLTPLTDEENELLLAADADADAELGPSEPGLIFDLDGIETSGAAVDSAGVQAMAADDEELKSFLSIAAATVDVSAGLPDQQSRPAAAVAETRLELAPDDMLFESAQQPAAAAVPDFDLSKYALVDDEKSGEIPGSAAQAPLPTAAPQDASRVRDGAKSGLFLVLSGVGGPGALRSLLEQIPSDFQGIVALCHQISAAQMPAFRSQLQKVAHVPVQAIEENDYFKTGNIYLLPQDASLFKTPLGYQCVRGGLDKFIGQIDHDAEILILSGADAALSQSLIQVSAVSGNIHVQNPEECYESGLVRQLINAGAPMLDRGKIEQWFN